MLTSVFQNRVRAAVQPPGVVTFRSNTPAFIDTIRRGWPDIAIIDPTLVRLDATVPASLKRAHLGAVLYIRLTPDHAASVIAFVRQLAAEVVTFGYNDDPGTFAALLTRSSRHRRGLLLLEMLQRQIGALPRLIRDGIRDLNERCDHVDSVATLASYTGVKRSALERRLREVGIRSTSNLVTGLNLVRNFDILADPTLSLQATTSLLGMSSVRCMSRRCVALSGLTPSVIRSGMTIDTFATRVAQTLIG
jgi:hypothetical protein